MTIAPCAIVGSAAVLLECNASVVQGCTVHCICSCGLSVDWTLKRVQLYCTVAFGCTPNLQVHLSRPVARSSSSFSSSLWTLALSPFFLFFHGARKRPFSTKCDFFLVTVFGGVTLQDKNDRLDFTLDLTSRDEALTVCTSLLQCMASHQTRLVEAGFGCVRISHRAIQHTVTHSRMPASTSQRIWTPTADCLCSGDCYSLLYLANCTCR